MDAVRPLRTVLVLAVAFPSLVATGVPASAATAGAIVFASTRDGADGDVFVQNADGSGLAQLTRTGAFEADPTWSPDGARIAFTRRVVNATCPSIGCLEIFVMNADGSGATRLTAAPTDGVDNRSPAWSPDGAWIAYATTRYGAKDVMRIPAAGGSPVRLTTDPAHDDVPAWSPDGSTIAFVSQRTGSAQLFTMGSDGSRQALVPLTGPHAPGALIGQPEFSPDGSRLAFRGAADRWSTTSVYSTALDGSGTSLIWSSPATKTWFSYDPSWSPSGDAIVFAVDTSTSTGFDLAIHDLAAGTWSWATRVTGDDWGPDWSHVAAPTIPVPPSTTTVTARNYAFVPADPTVPLGGSITWEFESLHTATDRTGLGLYDSGVLGSETTFTHGFVHAGTFPFACTLHPRKMSGTVSAPVSVDPASGSTSTAFTIRWATAAPPADAVFDVKLKRPGTKKWVTWRSGVTTRAATFVPDAGAGTYAFQARVRISNKRAARFSPVASIAVG
jgi:Tol biopolymer transport system component